MRGPKRSRCLHLYQVQPVRHSEGVRYFAPSREYHNPITLPRACFAIRRLRVSWMALHDHGHAPEIRRIRGVAHDVEALRARVTSLVCTDSRGIDAGNHELLWPHGVNPDPREGGVRIGRTDGAAGGKYHRRCDRDESHLNPPNSIHGGSEPQGNAGGHRRKVLS